MPSKNKLLRRKQEFIQQQAQNNGNCDAISLLNTPELLSIIEILQPDHRERQLPPTNKFNGFTFLLSKHRHITGL